MDYYIHTDKLKLAGEAVDEIAVMTGPPARPIGSKAEMSRNGPRLHLVTPG